MEVYRILLEEGVFPYHLEELKTVENTPIIEALLTESEPPPYRKGYFGEVVSIHRFVQCLERVRVSIIKEI
jgi:hypothetical protein